MSPEFNPVSLGDWIAVCEKASVPHIPAELIAEIPVSDMMEIAWNPEECKPSKEFDVEWAKLREAIRSEHKRRYMVRWDCCAPDGIKSRMSAGQPAWCHNFTKEILTLDDPRLFDILSEYPRPRVAAYRRPWVDAVIINGYPLEFRVFVERRELVGISSYYPQRPLSLSEDVVWAIAVLLRRTNEMIKATPPHIKNFTLDWLVAKNESRVMFIEGGPAHTEKSGAHPCCFVNGYTHGIALSPMPGSEAAARNK